jgi:hypothetical protein
MKKYFLFIFILIGVLFTACSKDNNPLIEEENKIVAGHCDFAGLEVKFADTCSYYFIKSFFQQYDSIKITYSSLGGSFYLYADSGDYNYWSKYFENDSTIQNINSFYSADSLILKIDFTGENTLEIERQRLLSISNLTIIKSEKPQLKVFINVPEKTEAKWEALFKQYSFISYVYTIYVCLEE